MDTEIDYPVFPITFLPKELIKLILTKVDWRTIYNVRLTSKFFNAMFLKYFDIFQKPNLNEFKIHSKYETSSTIKIRYFMLCDIGNLKIERLYNLEDKKDTKVQEYLKKMNLKNITTLDIAVNNYSPVFKIINSSFTHGTSVENLYLIINNSPVFKMFSDFIEKLTFISHVYINRLCFSHSDIPPNFTLPMIHNLRHIFIVECECTKFINSKMINELFKKNNNLNGLAIYTKNTDFEDDILRNIRLRQMECSSEADNHKVYTISLARKVDYDKDREFSRYFPCGTYTMVTDFFSFNSIRALKKCYQCNYESGIFMNFLHMDGYIKHNYL